MPGGFGSNFFGTNNSGQQGYYPPTTAPTAGAFTGWDANANLSSNNLISGYATTVTAAGTTTLTVASAQQQYFTGTSIQTVVMPVESTLVNGHAFVLVNNSNTTVTVQSSGANSIRDMAPYSQMTLTVTDNSVTTAAAWNVSYRPLVVQTFATQSLLASQTSTTVADFDISSFFYYGAIITYTINISAGDTRTGIMKVAISPGNSTATLIDDYTETGTGVGITWNTSYSGSTCSLQYTSGMDACSMSAEMEKIPNGVNSVPTGMAYLWSASSVVYGAMNANPAIWKIGIDGTDNTAAIAAMVSGVSVITATSVANPGTYASYAVTSTPILDPGGYFYFSGTPTTVGTLLDTEAIVVNIT